MATGKNEKKTLNEIADFTAKQSKFETIEQFKQAAKAALQLLDLQNAPTKTYTVYSKEALRGYLKNPLSEANQKNLRKVSQFLYVLSPQYRRIISYFATQMDLTAYSVIPNISMTEDNDDEKILENYESTLKWLEVMNLAGQVFSQLVTAWKEDVFFGYIYYNEEDAWDKNNFLIVPLDGDYCKISSVNYDGTLNCAFDFSFFTGSNSVYLEYWDKEFTTKYNAYAKDSKLRWQELDPERTWVFKINYEQTDRILPPLASIFESVIDNIDLQSIVSEKDAMSIYKLLVAKIDTMSGTNTPDDFEISLDLAVDFYNKIVASLPPEVAIALSPMSIEPITFDKNATDDTNEIARSNANLFEAAGVSQIMDKSKLTGATAIRSAMIFDGLYATNPVLYQIEARVNRFLDFVLPDNMMRVKYMRDVTPYNKQEKITQLKDAASLGMPVKTQYLSLLGVSPMDGYSLSYLENNILKLQDNWKYPLQSSYTQTANKGNGGAPEKDVTELTDEGDKTKDQEKNKQ